MKNYEIMFIVKPDLEAKAIKDTAESMKKLITDMKAKSVEMKDLGQKDLAYEIRDYKTGYYYLINLETDKVEIVKEFDRVALINENIIRHLIIKMDE